MRGLRHTRSSGSWAIPTAPRSITGSISMGTGSVAALPTPNTRTRCMAPAPLIGTNRFRLIRSSQATRSHTSLEVAVTSGNPNRKSYRGGRRPAAVLVLVCFVAAASWFGSSLVLGSAGASLAKATESKQPWCKAKPNSAWKRVLRGRVVPLSRRVSIGPIALANDGRSFYAEIYSKGYSGVVKINALSGRYIKIKRFSDPVNYQVSGDFDGRWLVWAEYHSLYDYLSDFTVWSWDSRTGLLRRIGRAKRSPSGKFWPSAWQAPVAHEGYAAWQQGAGPDN